MGTRAGVCLVKPVPVHSLFPMKRGIDFAQLPAPWNHVIFCKQIESASFSRLLPDVEQWVLNVCPTESHGGRVKRLLGPTLEALIQSVWAGNWESAFLTSSQVIPAAVGPEVSLGEPLTGVE